LVAGRKRVPRPATGNTAVRIADFELVLIEDSPKVAAVSLATADTVRLPGAGRMDQAGGTA
jgi:hypothetical protein